MDFYKLVNREGTYCLEEETGQEGILLDNCALRRWALLLYSCYRQQEQLPLRFRRYLTAYYENGEMEYIALADAGCLDGKPKLDGFATTWLEGTEENRVWIGADGIIENRGPSGIKVKQVLNLLSQAITNNDLIVYLPMGENCSDGNE